MPSLFSDLFFWTGNVISFGLFILAMPTFYRIVNNKSVKGVKPEYHLALMMNCLFWVFYGMPFIHPRNILVLMAYGIVLAIQLTYLIIFLIYANDDNKQRNQRMYVGGVFLIELAVIGLVIGSVIILAPTVEAREHVVGAFCFFSVPVVYVFEPLTIERMTEMMKTESECVQFGIVLGNTLYRLCWTIYALLKYDLFLTAANFPGIILGVIQLCLCGVYMYHKSSPMDYFASDRRLATAEVQVQGIGTGADKKLATAELQC